MLKKIFNFIYGFAKTIIICQIGIMPILVYVILSILLAKENALTEELILCIKILLKSYIYGIIIVVLYNILNIDLKDFKNNKKSKDSNSI